MPLCTHVHDAMLPVGGVWVKYMGWIDPYNWKMSLWEVWASHKGT